MELRHPSAGGGGGGGESKAKQEEVSAVPSPSPPAASSSLTRAEIREVANESGRVNGSRRAAAVRFTVVRRILKNIAGYPR